jgi:hypothetical protein
MEMNSFYRETGFMIRIMKKILLYELKNIINFFKNVIVFSGKISKTDMAWYRILKIYLSNIIK